MTGGLFNTQHESNFDASLFLREEELKYSSMNEQPPHQSKREYGAKNKTDDLRSHLNSLHGTTTRNIEIRSAEL
jgi:hypothetical protein